MSNAEALVGKVASQLKHAVTLFVGEVPYEVLELEGREQLNELYRFSIKCIDTPLGTAPYALIGTACRVELRDRHGAIRTITGLVAEASRKITDTEYAETTIEVRPAAYPLTLSRDSRVFHDVTVPQIVDQVMKKSPAKHRWELTENYRSRVYTAQYREDDWVFVSRLLEEEGIYYWFDHHEGESTLVFSDDSPHAPDLIGGSQMEFVLESGMITGHDHIYELASEAHATATKFTVGSFDPWNPALKVSATEGDGIHEMYDAPGGGPESPDVCAKQARVRYQSAQSHRSGVSGNSASTRIEPGRVMTVFNHPVFDGRYLVRAVDFHAVQRGQFSQRQDAERSFECHFEMLRVERPFRPPEVSPLAKQAGIQSGRIGGPAGKEIHIDKRGRVRAQLHWDRNGGWDDKSGKWMRVAQRGVANSMMYPRIGWNVMTFMEEGNVDAPTVLSRVHDAEHPPTYPLPANMTRTVFRTLTSPGGGSANEIRYEDLAGSQEMFLNASKDMNYVVNETNTLKVGNDHERKIENHQELTVGNTMLEEVQNDQTVKISGGEKLDVKDDYQKTVTNDEKETITGGRKLEIGSNFAMQVRETRELKVTGDMVERCEGKFKLAARDAIVDCQQKVTHKCKGNNSVYVGSKHSQTITGSKTETCKGNFVMEVNQTLTETFQKNYSLTCFDTYSDGSDELTVWDVKQTLSGRSLEVFLSAKEKITLQVGASTIVMDKKDIRVTSPAYKLDRSKEMEFVATTIKHNNPG